MNINCLHSAITTDQKDYIISISMTSTDDSAKKYHSYTQCTKYNAVRNTKIITPSLVTDFSGN